MQFLWFGMAVNAVLGFWAVRKAAILAIVATIGIWVTGIQADIEGWVWDQFNALSPELYAVFTVLGLPDVITITFWAFSFAFHWWGFRKAFALI